MEHKMPQQVGQVTTTLQNLENFIICGQNNNILYPSDLCEGVKIIAGLPQMIDIEESIKSGLQQFFQELVDAVSSLSSKTSLPVWRQLHRQVS